MLSVTAKPVSFPFIWWDDVRGFPCQLWKKWGSLARLRLATTAEGRRVSFYQPVKSPIQ